MEATNVPTKVPTKVPTNVPMTTRPCPNRDCDGKIKNPQFKVCWKCSKQNPKPALPQPKGLGDVNKLLGEIELIFEGNRKLMKCAIDLYLGDDNNFVITSSRNITSSPLITTPVVKAPVVKQQPEEFVLKTDHIEIPCYNSSRNVEYCNFRAQCLSSKQNEHHLCNGCSFVEKNGYVASSHGYVTSLPVVGVSGVESKGVSGVESTDIRCGCGKLCKPQTKFMGAEGTFRCYKCRNSQPVGEEKK